MKSKKITDQQTAVQTGLEVFLADGLPQRPGKRVGLVTSASGVNRQLRSTIDLLFADQRLHLRALFAPEHGILGNVQAGVEIAEQDDPCSS